MPADPKPDQVPLPSESVMEGLDRADPHPAEEGDPYHNGQPHPPHSPAEDIGPNPAKHTGTPTPRPRNVESGL